MSDLTYMQGTFPVLLKNNIGKNIFDMVIHCPEIAKEAKPGQFVHIRVPGHILRRPISIAEITTLPESQGSIRIIYEIRGEGTKWLSDVRAGEMVDVLGPLGNGYPLEAPDKKCVVVGGGIGVPPLLAVAKHYGANATAVLGFRSAQAAILENDFKKAGARVILCTDDGTLGRKGFVTGALEELLQSETPDLICACGPTVMLKAVASLAKGKNIKSFLSLEERMACGVGACLGCACKISRGGEEFTLHVCKDGPVFSGEEVVF